VIRYPSDTTRFTFRGSYETAVQAYRRALLLAPAFNLTSERRAIERLPRLLFAERWYTAPGCYGRLGLRRVPRAGGGYASVLRLAWGGCGCGREGVEPPSHLAAVARNRRILMEVSTSFADAFPDEPQPSHTGKSARVGRGARGRRAPLRDSRVPRGATSRAAARAACSRYRRPRTGADQSRRFRRRAPAGRLAAARGSEGYSRRRGRGCLLAGRVSPGTFLRRRTLPGCRRAPTISRWQSRWAQLKPDLHCWRMLLPALR